MRGNPTKGVWGILEILAAPVILSAVPQVRSRRIRFCVGGLRILRLRASHFAQDDRGGTRVLRMTGEGRWCGGRMWSSAPTLGYSVKNERIVGKGLYKRNSLVYHIPEQSRTPCVKCCQNGELSGRRRSNPRLGIRTRCP